ncbi:MAG: hypothetical protein OJF49_002319 [Ktedonobacterales bacterium]|jgi:hypothetical protein|nr:MAG: hypothetical protein OJF49_002319 [Ktedonobacterales bacterium]
MLRATWLDRIVHRFQHRWETNAQYRAAVSGVVGLVVILSMCACMGVMTTAANATLASLGLGSASTSTGSSNTNTGTNTHTANEKFPISTPFSATNPPAPLSTIASSGTAGPDPTPTATDTPVPTDTPGGGGGGGGGGACSGGNSGVSWSLSPCPMHVGDNVTLTFTTSIYAGRGIGQVEFNYGCTDGNPACGYILTGMSFSSSGVWSNTLKVPSDALTGIPASGNCVVQGGPTVFVRGPAVLA